MFLEEYNYVIIEKTMSDFNDGIEIYSDDSYNEDSDDSDESDKEYSDEKIQINKIKYINLFLQKTRKI